MFSPISYVYLYCIFQGDVLARMIDKGIGVGISKWATTKEIVDAIHQVLDNPQYGKNVDHLSKLMKLGMKQKPMENAVWWLEYLSETKGAEHLKLSSRHLNFFQYHSLDFIVIVLIIVYLFVKFITFLLKRRKLQNSKIKRD